MNELVLLESRTARQSQLSDLDDSHALNALNKAKALMMAMWNGTGVATTEQMAEYYEVPSETVDSVIKRNRKELEPDGLKAIRGNDLKELKFIMNFAQNGTTSLTIWTPRAAVRLGMLLRDSLVA